MLAESATALSVSSGPNGRSLPSRVGDVVVERVACWVPWIAAFLFQLAARAPKP